MAHLSGKTIHTQMGLTVHEDTTAQSAVTDRHHHEVLQTVSTAESFLTKCRHMCIVGQGNSQSQSVTKHGSQGNNALPRHIGGVLNTASHEVGTWGTHTYGTHLVITTVLLYQHDDFLTQGTDIVSDFRIVHRVKIVRRNNLTTYIHQRIGGSNLTNVDTYDSGFDLINRFHICKP